MKSLQKCFLFCLISLLLINANSFKIKAEDSGYYVADVSSGVINKLESFDSFGYANDFYINNINDYDNLVLFYDDQVIKMEYGIVEFKTNDTGTLAVGYSSKKSGGIVSINGCYGIDGAYLYTSDDGSYVHFKVAGDMAYTKIDDVILHPYELLKVRPSTYMNMDGSLYHNVMTNTELDYYSYSYPIDEKLDYLSDNEYYYSYDGNYFYDNFKTMIDDYKNDEYTNAINSENPYFNYYQYLPYRSLTNYDYDEIESYFYDVLKIEDKIYSYDDQSKDGANDVVNNSQYYDELKSFVENQNIYGTNAMTLLSISMNESSYGKSYAAFTKNNLFSVAAYESDEERTNDRYNAVSNSIYSFSKYYLSRLYSNYRNALYKGSYLGNKVGGMNVNYSSDPYWGEKAASNYYLMDKELGYKDLNSYCLGIISDLDTLTFYNDEKLSDSKFKVKNLYNYSLIILEELNNSYKVQVDPSFNEEYKYDFNSSIAYIDKDEIDYLLNEENIHENEMVPITFELDNETITVNVLKGTTPVLSDPIKNGYSFVSFDQQLKEATEEKTYIAKFKEISDITVNSVIDRVMLGEYLDLSNDNLVVTYKDGSKEIVKINTNMISSFDMNTPGDIEITIKYGGISKTQTINISEELKVLHDSVSNLIDQNIETYKTSKKYVSSDMKTIKRNLYKLHYDYNIDTVRSIDEILLTEYRSKANYRIDENDYDISLSGLTLSLADPNITSLFKPFTDTYYVHVGKASASSKNKISEIGKAYGFEMSDSFNISFSYNMQDVDLDGAVIVSFKPKDKLENKIYTVYRLDEDGKIVKCKTTQTDNYIQFLTTSGGNFVLLEKNSVNTYSFDDFSENITQENSDPDNHSLFINGGILLILIVAGLACIVSYIRNENKRKVLWNDYKKSLQKVESVQEEKPKN